jgi:hypothetical protein
MKIPIVLSVIAIILVGVVVGSGIYVASLDDVVDPSPSPTPNPGGVLTVSNLFALSNGTVSFDVTLSEGDSGILQAVFVNDTKYLWSEGSSESSMILANQSKSWRKDLGVLIVGSQVEVLVQATPKSTSGITVVSKIPEIQSDFPDYYYDVYSGVNLFERGVYFVVTSQNPLTQLQYSSFPQSYWSLMHQNITIQASDQDFISILISRGDWPTGGYGIAVESFSWLESYPVKFRFHVNFTDPGDDVIVTQALTNPMVLVPIGELSPGEYQVEIHIVTYIQTFDEHGNVEWITVMTFKEEVWTQNLTITDSQGSIPLTTFGVTVNESAFSDLIVAVDLTQNMIRETAEKITDAIFVHVKGENVLFELNEIVFSDQEIVADYIWGLSEVDMSHIFEITVDLINLQVEVIHCL